MVIQKIKTKLTPVRMPGGKSNALKYLDPYFIKDFAFYREPFFGGGSLGLYLMQFNKTADYWINDLFYPVYGFWKTLYDYPNEMIDCISYNKQQYIIDKLPQIKKGIPSRNAENGKELHKFCRRKIESSIYDKDEFHTACYWYILNKTSFSGMAMIGNYAPLAWDQNFTDNCIKNLINISNLMHSVKSLKITNLDYSELLNDTNDNTFIVCDPPYDIKHNLYGNDGDMHREFNHKKFADDIKNCKSPKWMITYNDNEIINEWFKDYRCIPWNLQYTMKAAKRTTHGNLISEKKKLGQNPKLIQMSKDNSSEKTGKKGKELLILNY